MAAKGIQGGIRPGPREREIRLRHCPLEAVKTLALLAAGISLLATFSWGPGGDSTSTTGGCAS